MKTKIKKIKTEVEMMSEACLSCAGQWIGSDEVMQKFGISRRTLQSYRDNGILPYSTVGGKFYYSIRDITCVTPNL